jgi:hypothetical protein
METPPQQPEPEHAERGLSLRYEEERIMDSGGGGQQTVTQVQQIPEWQKDFSMENMDIARSLAAQPYPEYQGQIIADFSPQQQAALGMTGEASTAWQPGVGEAENMTRQAAGGWNTGAAAQYMSPFLMASLEPQLQAHDLNMQQRLKGDNAAATRAGAFGDSRHGIERSMDKFFGDMTRNNIISTGLNQGYNTGQAAFQTDQARKQSAGAQMGTLAGTRQQLGIEGANALFNAGGQQQQQHQQILNKAYENFMNKVNWDREQLNLRIAALANAPYSKTNIESLAPTNATAQQIGAFSALAGMLGKGGVFGSQ